jgi:predicted extracellular nuclease
MSHSRLRFALTVSLLAGFLSAPLAGASETNSENSDGTTPLRVMFYNVYNLFDDQHDEGKQDWEFLPFSFAGKLAGCERINVQRFRESCLRTDWTADHLELKLSQIERALRSTGRWLPDVLGLVEIENEAVVAMLAERLGYNEYYVSESPDRRGIDVAILAKTGSKINYQGHQEFEVDFGSHRGKATRNVLAVEFLANNDQPLVVLVNHWPSQGNSTADRLAAAKTMKKAVATYLNRDQSTAIIAGGDFNTIDRDSPHPLNSILYHSSNPNQLFDMHAKFMGDTRIPASQRRGMAEGTYFYTKDMTWNLLDRIMVNRSLTHGRGMRVKTATYKIHANDLLSREWEFRGGQSHRQTGFQVPRRYNNQTLEASEAGFSDHYPLSVVVSIP